MSCSPSISTTTWRGRRSDATCRVGRRPATAARHTSRSSAGSPRDRRGRRSLLATMEALGARVDRLKAAAAWGGEKLGRLKLNGQLRGYSPLSRVVELEGLALGVWASGDFGSLSASSLATIPCSSPTNSWCSTAGREPAGGAGNPPHPGRRGCVRPTRPRRLTICVRSPRWPPIGSAEVQLARPAGRAFHPSVCWRVGADERPASVSSRAARQSRSA